MSDPFRSLYERQKDEVDAKSKGFGAFTGGDGPTDSSGVSSAGVAKAESILQQIEQGFDPRTSSTSPSMSLLTPTRVNTNIPANTAYTAPPPILSSPSFTPNNNNIRPQPNYNVRIGSSSPGLATPSTPAPIYVIYQPNTATPQVTATPSLFPSFYQQPTQPVASTTSPSLFGPSSSLIPPSTQSTPSPSTSSSGAIFVDPFEAPPVRKETPVVATPITPSHSVVASKPKEPEKKKVIREEEEKRSEKRSEKSSSGGGIKLVIPGVNGSSGSKSSGTKSGGVKTAGGRRK